MNETEPDLEELKMFESLKVGHIRPTKDINVLKKLNLSQMHTPDIVKTNVRKNDSLNIKELDRIEWANNMFFEYVSQESNLNGLKLIIPFEIELNFFAGFRKGLGSRFGPNQELAAEWLWPFRVEMKECQIISNEDDSGKVFDIK